MDLCKIAQKADERLSKRFGYRVSDTETNLMHLLHGLKVEVGRRNSCGKTDPTMYVHREWLALVKKMQLAGYVISVEPVKHKNSYATIAGGFWASEIYEVQQDPRT